MPAVVFDFDGLIIDSEHEMATHVLAAFEARGQRVTMDDIAHLFGSTDTDHLWEALLHGLFAGEFGLAELEAELNLVLPSRLDALPLLPGVVDVLDAALAAGWPTGMATGQQRPRLEEHLVRLGIRDQFDAIVTAAEVARGKPAPDIFLEVADRLGQSPAECLVLEDSLPGCEAALAAGMTVVVCPSRVTIGCAFPEAAKRVGALTEVLLELPSHNRVSRSD